VVVPVSTISPVVAEFAELAPTPVEAPLPQLHAGAAVTVPGSSLGSAAGRIVIQTGELALPAQVQQWNDDGVDCVLPLVGVAQPVRAQLHVVLPNGSIALTVDFELLPPKS